MNYKPTLFNPLAEQPQHCKALEDGKLVCNFGADARLPASTYVYDAGLLLALNVALATGRPLLLAGEPGCGKTTLALNVARVLKRAYYHQAIASRSQASELLWEVDTLRRLNDAYDPKARLQTEDSYLQPGMLWWALAPESARWRGLPEGARDGLDPLDYPPQHVTGASAVLLIDEIDKAEPDLPNDLLEVLDTRGFHVRGRRVEPERNDVLVLITTNLERDLPGAFMRRCVVHRFAQAQAGWFTAIARQRHPQVHQDAAKRLEDALLRARDEASHSGARLPGTAEYLDALVALQALGLDQAQPDQARLAAIAEVERCIFGKHAAVQP